MIDFEARQIIEALRSGVSSRVTSQYFSFARPQLIENTTNALRQTSEHKISSGMIVSGKYGEGKTHFLNTVFNLAQQNNMVVSHISLSKETPFDKIHLIYQKLMSNTYLPSHMQPGFEQVFDNMTIGCPIATDLLEFAKNELETNKLYYLLKSYLSTSDEDEKYLLLSDLEGDFINNVILKQIYRRIFGEPVAYSANFSKTKHCMDYFCFLSHLFSIMGYNGWVILFDEAELIGRLGKKARINAYSKMASFLFPNEEYNLKSTRNMSAVYSVFALTASFIEDVIESKHEFENLETLVLPEECKKSARQVLELIMKTTQLEPLSRDEIVKVLQKVTEFHGKAYEWTPDIDIEKLYDTVNKKGHLLRTGIRAAVEFLDQLYQYGDSADISVNELGLENYDEDPVSLDELI